jgi:(heptosyl)LPS beta-1,4-glucosyltransferase
LTERTKVTAVILAKNEKAFIERAICSVWWADEILVLDSESVDGTRERAAALGAVVHSEPWLGWLPQKARALELSEHDWIFSLDADEIVTPTLAASIVDTLKSNPDPRDGFVVNRIEEFLGEPMPNTRRRSKSKTFVRLFNKTRSGWDPALIVHEEIRCPGVYIALRGDLLHWRNYSIGRQLDTINRNADLEAKMMLARSSGVKRGLDVVVRPILRFGWLYIVCGLWRRGTKGFIWASLHTIAEFLRQAKAWEAANVQPVPDPPNYLYDPKDHAPIIAAAGRTIERAPAAAR